LKLSEFRPNDSDDSIPIYLRLPENQRTIDQLNSIKIPTSNGYVPISNFTDVQTKQETGNIVRLDQNRIETIKSDVTRFYQTDAYVRLIKHWLGIQKFDIPNNFGLDIPEFNSANIDPRVEVTLKERMKVKINQKPFFKKHLWLLYF
jgi:multidrug efflux pump